MAYLIFQPVSICLCPRYVPLTNDRQHGKTIFFPKYFAKYKMSLFEVLSIICCYEIILWWYNDNNKKLPSLATTRIRRTNVWCILTYSYTAFLMCRRSKQEATFSWRSKYATMFHGISFAVGISQDRSSGLWFCWRKSQSRTWRDSSGHFCRLVGENVDTFTRL